MNPSPIDPMHRAHPPELPMHTPRKGPVRQFFGGLFAAVDFTRRLVVNAIFLLIVFIFVIAIFSGGTGPLEQKTTLVIDPQGAIV